MQLHMKAVDFIRRLLAGRDTERVIFCVVSIRPGALANYNDSVGWMLINLRDAGKVPSGVVYTGVGKTDKEVEVYFDRKLQTKEGIKSFLESIGLGVE